MSSLIQLFDSISSTRNQINDIKASTLISEGIKKAIEQDIKPKYYFENKIASLKDTLLMLTLCAGIITSILPYSLSIVITMPLYIVSLIYLMKLFATYLGNDDLLARTSLYRNIYQMSFLFSGSLSVFVIIVFSNSTIYRMFNLGEYFIMLKNFLF
jgi:hypothetical protein